METLNIVIEKWEGVGFTSLQSEWDPIQDQIKSYQSQSLTSRKELAQSTKSFVKLSDNEKLTNIKNLLKSYQSEIDQLTKRCKYAESSWLDTVQKLNELPDPINAFQFAIEHYGNTTTELDTTTKQLKECQLQRDQLLNVNIDIQAELNDMKSENSELVSKLKQLETLQETFDTSLEEQITQRETEIQQEYSTKLENFQEREKLLTKQLQDSDDYLITLKQNFNENQQKLLEQKDQESERYNLTLHQLNLIKEQNDGLQFKLTKLKDENKELSNNIQQLQQDPNTPINNDSLEKMDELKQTIDDQEEEISNLVKQVKTLQFNFNTKESQLNLELKKLNDSLQSEKSTKEDLESKLQRQSNYDQLMVELNVLKNLEFPTTLQSPTSDQASQFTLMQSLNSKNTQLQSELTQLKQNFTDLSSKLNQLESLQGSNQLELKSKEELIEILEKDLLLKSNGNLNDGEDDAMNNADNATNTATSNDPNSLVTIITGQRDRFRNRNLELEEELNQLQDLQKDLNLELKQLKFDNLKLFEKLKYQNQYNLNGNGAINTTGGVNSRSSSASKSDTIIEMSQISKKYQKEYDLKNNPFQEFTQREQSKRYRQLHPIDRLVLNLTKLLTMNRYTRFGLLGYIVILHLLVFVTTWHTLVFKSGGEEAVEDTAN